MANSYGFLTKNSSNNIQISNTAIYLTPIHRKYSWGKNTLKISEPIHVISPKNGTLAMRFTPPWYSGTDPSNGMPYEYSLTGEGSVVSYRSDIPLSNSDTYGINIYNNSGNLLYDASVLSMKVLETVYIPDIRNSITYVNGIKTFWTKTYPGLDVGYLIVRYPTYRPNNGNPDNVFSCGLCRRGDTYSIEEGLWANYFGSWGSTWAVHFVLVDITGIV